MVAVYVSLIQKGLRAIEQVPTLWREQVQRELKE